VVWDMGRLKAGKVWVGGWFRVRVGKAKGGLRFGVLGWGKAEGGVRCWWE